MQTQPSTRLTQPKLHLVPARNNNSNSPLALWHLLSLDAPTVATLWTLFLARSTHLHLPWQSPTAMFLAVWMIYAADRLLDARVLDIHNPQTAKDLEARHRFHHRHHKAFLTAITLSSVALVALIHQLPAATLHLYALLATLLAAWLLLVHASAARLPKELGVGIFFAAAIFIPTVAHRPDLRLHLLPAATLFAATCTLNCLYLYAWEHPRNLTSAHPTTRWSIHHLQPLTLTILTLSLALHTLPTYACAISATALLLLNQNRHKLSPLHLRATADLLLLTPLLLLPLT